MPNFDGTGPTGAGPRTGRGMGPCAGSWGAGYGMRGRGYGRGMGAGCACPMGMGGFYSPRNQLAVLKDEEAMLANELETLREEIKALEGEAK